MRKLLLIVAFVSCGAAFARPQYFQPTTMLRPQGLDFTSAAIDGDWVVASGIYITNVDPDDPTWSFDWYQKVLVYHRASSGEWQLAQTLADQYLIFNSDEHFADPRDVTIGNGVIAFGTNSGLQVYELVSGSWVQRTVVGNPGVSAKLETDGTTVLASSSNCGTAATAFSRQPDGSWAATGSLAGHAQCDEWYTGTEFALNGSRALVYEDDPNGINSARDHVRVFQRSGTAWQPGPLLPAPANVDTFYGPQIALRGDLALVGGGDTGTHVYRRGASGFIHQGTIPLLVYAFDRMYATDLAIGPYFAVQGYPGPFSYSDLAVLQPNSAGGLDHVATLGAMLATGQSSIDVSGRRVVSVSYGLNIFELPETFTPPVSSLDDFETGSDGWTTTAGQFAVAQRGRTHVYRQSSLSGDALSLQSGDLTATTISADIRATAFNGNDRWVGLVARYTDENNHYYLTIRNDRFAIRKKVNGVITEIAAYGMRPQLGQNYHVTFEVVGQRVALYLEGVPLIDRYDDSLTHGRAGLRTYKASAEFDNVFVSAAPLQDLAAHYFGSDIGLFEPVDGAWRWGGPYHLQQTSTTGDARILHGNATDDQVLRVTATLDYYGAQTTGSHWIGAFVRYSDPANYYYVSVRNSNEISLRKLVNGVITVLDTAPFSLPAESSVDLRIAAIGTKLTVHANGEVVLEAQDSSHPRGRYGVLTYRAAASYATYRAWQP